MADIVIADTRSSVLARKKKRVRKPSTRRFIDPLAPSLLASTHSTRSVPGTESFLSPGISLPQEVKYNDITLAAVPTAQDLWRMYNGSALFSIAQGLQTFERIGRTIRVVGIVLRAAIETIGDPRTHVPFVMDFLWDQRVKAGAEVIDPDVLDVYAGIPQYNLPNALYNSRFKFIKRVELHPKHARSTLNVAIPCNKLVCYDFPTVGADSLANVNLWLTVASAYNSYNITGRLRILYVDA